MTRTAHAFATVLALSAFVAATPMNEAHVRQGTVKVRQGSVDEAALTIRVGAADYVNILNGEANGKAIFASGRGQVAGSIRLAMRLGRIFPLDR